MKVAKKRKKREIVSSDSYQGYMSRIDNGEVIIFETKKVIEKGMGGYLPEEILFNLANASSWDNKGGMKPAQRLRVYDKYVPALIDAYFAQQEIISAFKKENERVTENKLERGGKRWH